VIADNVGDKVGDVAGIGADNFDIHSRGVVGRGFSAPHSRIDRPAVRDPAARPLRHRIASSSSPRFVASQGRQTRASAPTSDGVLCVILPPSDRFSRCNAVSAVRPRPQLGCSPLDLAGLVIARDGLHTDFFTNYEYRPVRNVA
jgi:hypothetical protein